MVPLLGRSSPQEPWAAFTRARWFHDFETTSKSMRFGSVYTEPFSPENPSHDGVNEASLRTRIRLV